MQVFNSWRGPGKGYEIPDAQMSRITANQRSTFGQSPFRMKQGPDSIMAASARNTGDNRVQWGATQTADEISRGENFKF